MFIFCKSYIENAPLSKSHFRICLSVCGNTSELWENRTFCRICLHCLIGQGSGLVVNARKYSRSALFYRRAMKKCDIWPMYRFISETIRNMAISQHAFLIFNINFKNCQRLLKGCGRRKPVNWFIFTICIDSVGYHPLLLPYKITNMQLLSSVYHMFTKYKKKHLHWRKKLICSCIN